MHCLSFKGVCHTTVSDRFPFLFALIYSSADSKNPPTHFLTDACTHRPHVSRNRQSLGDEAWLEGGGVVTPRNFVSRWLSLWIL